MPGGGLTEHGEWRTLPHHDKFAFPVQALSQVVRGRFLKLLRHAYKRGQLQIPSVEEELHAEYMLEYFLDDLARDKWVTYAKRPFGGPEQVLKYLGRYTHRVALSNSCILDIEGGRIRLVVKDYRHGGRRQIVTLSAQEFTRRFLHHVLPKRFHKIRYGGFMVCTVRQEKLALAPQALGLHEFEPAFQEPLEVGAESEKLIPRCPKCFVGKMKSMVLPRWMTARLPVAEGQDSS